MKYGLPGCVMRTSRPSIASTSASSTLAMARGYPEPIAPTKSLNESVNTAEAVELIGAAIPRRGETWADLGAGNGTFTRALVELLGPDSSIYAVDRDRRAVAALERWAKREAPAVIPVVADFTKPFDLPGLGDARLD